jgi:glyoxylase-like metal-dependent hydrolase (beta-lactamase superfamily II)
VSRSWFATSQVEPGVWLIAEPGHVNTWLVEGRDRSVLLDTGLGIAPIRPVAERLTDRPIDIVNTHHHFDHTGGNHEFERIAIHSLGAPLLAEPPPRELLDGYLDYLDRLLAAADAYRRLDREFFHLLDGASDPRPLPAGFNRDSWTIAPSRADRLLTDGDRLDLGGRGLTVLHTPGHSPDSISLLDERAGLLFAGDTVNTGPIYAQFPDSDLEAFARSTARLADLAPEVRRVAVHHFGRATADPVILTEVAAGFDALANGVALERSRDCVGNAVMEARFESFSILIADHDAGARLSPGIAGREEAHA